MYTLATIVLISGIIWISSIIAEAYRKKFERNFIFNKTSGYILAGVIASAIGFMLTASECTTNEQIYGLISLSPPVCMEISLDSEMIWFDIGSAFFILGLATTLYAWYLNISHSNLLWGMTQNLIQTIMVIAFSIFIILIILFLKESMNKTKK